MISDGKPADRPQIGGHDGDAGSVHRRGPSTLWAPTAAIATTRNPSHYNPSLSLGVGHPRGCRQSLQPAPADTCSAQIHRRTFPPARGSAKNCCRRLT